MTGRETNRLTPQKFEGTNNAALETASDDYTTNDMHYKLAFSVSIKAPKGAQVSFAKNRNFIRWLRDRGFAIKGVSSDTFQSAQIQQDLKSDGFNTEIVSVDRVVKDANGKPICLPYHYLKSAIYERRLMMYQKCDLLTDELIGLEKKADGHVDHTKQGIDSKDQADAVCGAIWLASKYAEEYSYNYGDNLNAALDANSVENYTREQMISDFEKELLQSSSFFQNVEARQSKVVDEYSYYDDLQNGIIII